MDQEIIQLESWDDPLPREDIELRDEDTQTPEEVPELNNGAVRNVVEKHRGKAGDLLSILQELQSRYLHLPEDALAKVAELTERPLVDIYAMATFYRAFTLKPRGKHLVSVCQGTACHVRGAPAVVEEVGRQLEIEPGRTTPSEEFTFETVNCLGACALGPVMVVDGQYKSNVERSNIKTILDNTRNGEVEIQTDDPRVFGLQVSCSNCNHTLLDSKHPIDGYPSIRITASFGQRHGWVRLSSLYGIYKVESKHSIPHDAVVNFFCPHCHGEFIGASRCVECDAPMIPLIMLGGGTLQICTRRGCKGHILNLGKTSID